MGIRGKILSITSVSLLAIAVSLFFNIKMVRDEYTKSLQSEVLAIARNLRSQLDRIRALGLDVAEIKGFEQQCQDVTREYPFIYAAIVIRSDGTILYHNDPSNIGQVWNNPALLESMKKSKEFAGIFVDEHGKAGYHVLVPSQAPSGGTDAAIVLSFPTTVIDAKVHNLVVHSTIIAVIFITLAVIIKMAMLSSFVTNPLSKLLTTVRDIRASGSLEKRVRVHSRDEIGQLASSFNEMLGSLQKAYDELEDRVAKRTAALTHANNELTAEITERKRVESALRESENRYRIVAEQTGQLVYDYDIPSGKIKWCGAIQETTGFSLKEFADIDITKWEELIHPEDRQMVTENLQNAFNRSEKFFAPYRFRRKDGQYFYVEDTAMILRDASGTPKRMLGAMKDITLKKMAEDELKRSHDLLEQRVRERTRELEEASEHLRQAQVELVQVEKMSMLGQLVAGVAHEINTPTGAILNVVSEGTENIRRLVKSLTTELRQCNDAAEWLDAACEWIVSRPAQGSEASMRDLRRQIEQELSGRGIVRERKIASIIAAFGDKWRQWPDLIERLQQGPILSVLESTLALKSAIEISHTSAQKIARIVKALRYYSHTGQDETTTVNLNESLDNTLVILHNRIKQVAEIKTNFDPNLPAVYCTPDISQVWTNILSNACDAIEECGEGFQGVIELATCVEGDTAVVNIKNTGKPIPEAIMQKIFDPFFTTKTVGKGTGLGLSICKGIINRCKGNIIARNVPEGVVFEVRLPIQAHPASSTDRKTTADNCEPISAR